MDRKARLQELKEWAVRGRAFSGWLHSEIVVTPLDGGLPWDYVAVAREAASRASRVVDLSTGGGERFATIAAGLPASFVATEEGEVNARVARGTLGPLGIPVVHCQVHLPRIPFAANAFDLVLSRHSAVDIADVDRILMPGGRFITQQVAPDNWPELRRHFPRMTVFENHIETYPAGLRDRGYEVSLHSHYSPTAYRSLGDLVFMLTTAPWEIPEFDGERDLEALLALEAECLRPEGLMLTEGHYLLEALKPG